MLVPIRKEEIRILASYFRKKFAGLTIDEVAERENIILLRAPDPFARKAGYAQTIPIGKRRKRFRSLANPSIMLTSYVEWETEYADCIVINTAYREHPDVPAIDERIVFWHEFYHLRYSPTKNSLQEETDYSFEYIPHIREENRADMFAREMLSDQYFANPETTARR
jgi:hypothetical protein